MNQRFAKLTDEQKDEAVKQVMINLKSKGDESEKPAEPEVNFGDIEFEESSEDSAKKPDGKPETEVDFGDIEFNETEEAGMSKEPDNLMDSIQSLSDELDKVKEDGKVDSTEVVGLFNSMMDMVSSLLRAKPGRAPRKASITDRVACTYLKNSSRGMQTRRKDKDLMSDTGGVSKGREREPSVKPPREENKKPYRTKDKPARDRDKDTDNDKDLK
jgi:hypothetical protein